MIARRAAPEATVIRNGDRRRVPASALVVGDLVLLEEGDTIPATADELLACCDESGADLIAIGSLRHERLER